MPIIFPMSETTSGKTTPIDNDGDNSTQELRNRHNNGLNPTRSRSKSAVGGRPRLSTATTAFVNFITNGTPVSSSQQRASSQTNRRGIFSLFRLLKAELNLPSSIEDSSLEEALAASIESAKTSYAHIQNMLTVPYLLERFMVFGLLVCFNSFLTLFTLVPLKITVISSKALVAFLKKPKVSVLMNHLRWVKKDLITIVLIGLSLFIISGRTLDISKMYHDIRGQAHIKLYVTFGMLDVAEKLFSAIGQDIQNVVYSLSIRKSAKKFTFFFILGIVYFLLHAYIIIYQTIALHVAANSYSNALLSLLMSNQFAELKSSVFKRFDREGLFQLTLSDLSERFQLTVMLSVITLRNLLQLLDAQIGILPNSWNAWNAWLGAIFGPAIVVIGSEIIVDWLKHCYITKFNKFRPRIYKNFLKVLSLDYLQVFKPNSEANHELIDYIVLTKRIGLPLIATVVSFLKMILPEIDNMIFGVEASFYKFFVFAFFLVSVFVVLILIRLILALVILRSANANKHEHDTPIQAHSSPKTSKEVTPTPQPKASTPTEKMSKVAEEVSPPSTITPPPILSPPMSPAELSFIPGVPNTELSSINPQTRTFLYDDGEVVPPTMEEKRNKSLRSCSNDETEGLGNVMRYEMKSKRIW